ncbi:MAG: pbpC [Chthoniobacteraceae bacterium]|nr:pbpC [Chthoniobacteraceae bacterium]
MCILMFAGALWMILPRPPPLDGISFSQRVYDRNGRLLRISLTSDEKYRIETPFEKISPDLVKAALLYEDQHYWEYPGVNPLALGRAAIRWCSGGAKRGGASTITMQLARMRYGIRSRTPSGKLMQIYRALQLTRHYSKKEILTAYFNLAPYGKNIEGVGAASLIYFDKSARHLSLHEAVALSVIPQNPTRRTLRVNEENPAVKRATDRLYARLGRSDSDFQARSRPMPAFLAPHFTTRLLREYPTRNAISSTLDLDMQRLLERRIAAYVESNRRLGIVNAAAMLVDSSRMEVIAQVGSAGFFNSTIHGQVDGTRSRRSPGSTLKPFIYALAMEQGLIHPLTMLKDAPSSFGGYNPENFDGEFVGPIKAADALARSRNIPAVGLDARLAHPTLYEFLKRGGVALPRSAAFYGLALPLGGGEVTMEELVRLYSAIANGGRLRPLSRTVPHQEIPGTRLFSPESAFLTLQMLGQVPRPGLGEPAGNDAVFWKTGTSHGFRDAWAVAVFDHYVMAVWVGNFDGKRNPAFIGRTCAGPLLFQMIDGVRHGGSTRVERVMPPAGSNLQEVEFCAVSGQLPTVACPHRVAGWFIPGISPITACEVHREVFVDDQSGLRLSVDDGSRALHREVYEFWPSNLLSLFERAGLPRRTPPPFLPGQIETAGRSGKAPSILSPLNHHSYSVRLGTTEAITLSAQAESDVARLYWFVGKTFLGAVSSREALHWRPTGGPGEQTISVLDDHGRSSSCSVVLD